MPASLSHHITDCSLLPIRYTKTDREKRELESVAKLELELEKLEAEAASLEPRLAEITERLEDRDKQLAEVRTMRQ